jgi:ABC-type phosphate transport system auxiliary subunit
MELNKNQEDLTKNLSPEELSQVKDYQRIHSRIRVLKAQMDEIKEETHDLIETLEKMRLKDKKNQ